MTWRLQVRHRTGYTYDSDVTSSFNEARMTPLTDFTQTCLDSRLDVSPSTSLYRYRDYWGTNVTSFDIQRPHSELVVTATSMVETYSDNQPVGGASWDEVRSDQARDEHAEWLGTTPRTDAGAELAALAASIAGSASPAGAAAACFTAVYTEMEYVPGSTGVLTHGVDAWSARKGVCQDFAHIALGMLRSLGIPSRYVSGYLHPRPDAEIGETVAGESHAWVQWWDGHWNGYDATIGKPVGQQHVAVAYGRDYDDVTPLKGTYAGAKSATLGVRVEVTRLA
jgi:transglutaminase-like putative cysteine protease